jgi:rod shape-determining protein MreD
MIKYLYYLLASLLLVFLSQSIFSALIPPENLNILIVFLVFITFVWGLNPGFIFAVFVGFLLNLYSYLPLGTYIVIYLIIIALVDYLHKQIFINFTFSTNIILILLSTILYGFLMAIISFIFYILGVTRIYISLDREFFNNLFWQTIFNFILISLVFIFAKAIFKKLNLAILIKR